MAEGKRDRMKEGQRESEKEHRATCLSLILSQGECCFRKWWQIKKQNTVQSCVYVTYIYCMYVYTCVCVFVTGLGACIEHLTIRTMQESNNFDVRNLNLSKH